MCNINIFHNVQPPMSAAYSGIICNTIGWLLSLHRKIHINRFVVIILIKMYNTIYYCKYKMKVSVLCSSHILLALFIFRIRSQNGACTLWGNIRHVVIVNHIHIHSQPYYTYNQLSYMYITYYIIIIIWVNHI